MAIAVEAGRIIRSQFGLSVDSTWKEDRSPLTEADIAIHELTTARLRAEFPNCVVLSEEGTHGNATESDEVWVCDPLDGTTPFISGYPTSVFALALCRSGDPVLGVLFDPYLDRMLVAEKGRGAELNGLPSHVNDFAKLETTTVDVSNLPHVKYFVPGLHEAIARTGARPTSLYSSAYAGLLLSVGLFAGVVLTQDTPWDGAAVQIVVEEAGGVVTSISGERQRYDRPIEGYVASNGRVHEELLGIIAELRGE